MQNISKIHQLAGSLRALGGCGNIKISSSISRQISKIALSASTISEDTIRNINQFTQGIAAMSALDNVRISSSVARSLNRITDAAARITPDMVDNVTQLSNALQGLGSIGNIQIPHISLPRNGVITNTGTQTPRDMGMTDISETTEIATRNTQALADSISEAGERMSWLKRIISPLGTIFHTAFGTGITGAKSLFTNVAKLPMLFGTRLISSVKQATSSLHGFFASVKRIAIFRLIRTAIKEFTQGLSEGIKNLYQYSTLMGGQFAQSMNDLATSSLYLKNSLGAMVAPLIEALAPAIEFIIDKIVTLLNLINQLFARLGGRDTYTAAKRVATSWGDAADSAGKSAKKAADDIKRYLLGFDELNILGNKTNDYGSGGSGGAGGAADYEDMFEELPIDNGLSEFVDRLKEAFMDQDWEGLGTLLGGKFNEIVDSIPWDELGENLGNFLDGSIKTAYFTLKEANFVNLGSKIAEFLNNAIANVDWEYLGRFLVERVTSLFDVVIGFINTFDFYNLAVSVSDFVKGVFGEITDWLNGHEWDEIGAKLWQDFKDLIEGFDFAGIASSFFELLGTALRSAADFLAGIIGEICMDIQDWWEADIQGDTWQETGKNLLYAIGEGIGNVGMWVRENVIDPFGSALFGEDWEDVKAGAKRLWNTITDNIAISFEWVMDNIVKPIKNGVDMIGDLMGVAWQGIKDFFHKAETTGKSFDAEHTFEGIDPTVINEKFNKSTEYIQIFKDAINKLLTALGLLDKGLGNTTTSKFNTQIGNANKATGDFRKTLKDLVENVFKQVQGGLDEVDTKTFETKIENSGKSFTEIFQNAVDAVHSKIDEINQWVQDALKPLLDFLGIEQTQTIEVTLDKQFGTLDEEVGDHITIIADLEKGNFNTLDEWVGEVDPKTVDLERSSNWVDGLSAWVGEIGEKAFSLGKDGWSTLRDWVGEIGQKVFGLGKDGWSTLRDWVGEIGQKAFSLGKSGWSSIADWVGSIGQKVFSLGKDGWSSISGFVGNIGTKVFGLGKDGWSSISGYVGNIGTKTFKLGTDGWSTISGWVGNIGTKTFKLGTDGWSTISGWVGNIGTKKFALGKDGWTTLAAYVGSTLSVAINLVKGNFSSLANWVGSTVTVTVNLQKGTSNLASGGVITPDGTNYFASGGSVTEYGKSHWGSLPKYGDGGIHGTMFVAGEAGPEVVGHINSRTEVLNKSQLAQTMHSAVVSGMIQFAPYVTSIRNKIAEAANALISSNVSIAGDAMRYIQDAGTVDTERMNNWMMSNSYMGSPDDADISADQIAEGVRQGMYDSTSRQNELLREQNELLRDILNKDMNIEVTTNSFTRALNRKNQRDGRTVVPVSY